MQSLVHHVLQYVGQTTDNLRSRMNGHRSLMHKGKEKDKEEEKDKDKDNGKDKEKESTISEDRFVHLDEGTLADHAISKHDAETSQDFNALYKVSILQINPHDMDAAEQIWIHKLLKN